MSPSPNLTNARLAATAAQRCCWMLPGSCSSEEPLDMAMIRTETGQVTGEIRSYNTSSVCEWLQGPEGQRCP